MKLFLPFVFGVITVFLFCFILPAYGVSFKIASYNVENLFDLHADETDYPEYLPGNRFAWDRTRLDIKLKNIAAVITDLDAEIVGLQEIESEQVLELLKNTLVQAGAAYNYTAIAKKRLTPVRCAILSRFPIVDQTEIAVGHGNDRSILKATVDVDGCLMVLYINHWKSKSGPESRRIAYAWALAQDLSFLSCDVDYALIGDFNSDYNEYETFKTIRRLNDTTGTTGINHIIHTVKDGRMIDEVVLTGQKTCQYVYNLWLEIPENRRWSVNFFGQKNSPDSIIVPKSLYDGIGISYVDNSFGKFDPDYLFNDGKVYRWQRAQKGKGRHLGKGFSDHLPVFATFSTAPFLSSVHAGPTANEPGQRDISGLYRMKNGPVDIRIKDAVVIFKEGANAVIKQKNGRAIYVYGAAKVLQHGMRYDLTVTHLKRYFGNLEVSGLKDIRKNGREPDLKAFFLSGPVLDLNSSEYRNEVVAYISGIYRNGWLHFEKNQKIRLYFPEPALTPADNTPIFLSYVRIGFHRHPEIIVEKHDQIQIPASAITQPKSPGKNLVN